MLDVAHICPSIKEGVIVYIFRERKKPTDWAIIAAKKFDVSGELCNCTWLSQVCNCVTQSLNGC